MRHHRPTSSPSTIMLGIISASSRSSRYGTEPIDPSLCPITALPSVRVIWRPRPTPTVVAVRLDAATLKALTERAQEEGLANRSEAIRAAVRAWTHVA